MSLIISLIVLIVAFPRGAWNQQRRNEVVGYCFVSFFGILMAALLELGLYPILSTRFFATLRWIAELLEVFK